MPIELIALDLDDTLLRTDLTISEHNRRALRAASAQGVRIVLASGRNIYSMKRYAEELDAAGSGEYMICSNGAEIVETATGRRIHEVKIAGPLCHEIVAALGARGFPYQVYEDGQILANKLSAWTEKDMKLSGQPYRIVSAEEEALLLDRGQMKFVIPGEPERIEVLKKELSELFDGRAEVLTSKPYFLEILAAGVDKGDALSRLCGFLGLGIEKTLAAGDAMNDLGMLRAAGLGCAPSNANPAAKAAAGYISPLSNEEDFVADIVERFVLVKASKAG
jgi:Cof subfamily protein (haloacid dehalogenase superfamily)